MKQSGIGRELGPHAIDEFMETKSVLIKTGKSSNWV
jgi:betaine-aldehyde dehydrogenase